MSEYKRHVKCHVPNTNVFELCKILFYLSEVYFNLKVIVTASIIGGYFSSWAQRHNIVTISYTHYCFSLLILKTLDSLICRGTILKCFMKWNIRVMPLAKFSDTRECLGCTLCVLTCAMHEEHYQSVNGWGMGMYS